VPVLLVRVGIDLFLRLFGKVDLHHRGHEGLPAGSDDSDGEFASRQESFHEDGLPETGQQFFANAGELRRVLDLRSRGDPLPRSLCDRFREKRIGKFHPCNLRRRFHNGEIGGRDAEIADHALGHPLVQRQRQHQRIGKNIGDAPGIQQGRDLRLPAEPPQALGNVEDDVPSFACNQPPGKCADVTDPVCFVAERPQRLLDRGNRMRMIEFSRFFLAVPLGEVILPQVVCDADLHEGILVLNGKSIFSISLRNPEIELPAAAPFSGQKTPALLDRSDGRGFSQWITFSSGGPSG